MATAKKSTAKSVVTVEMTMDRDTKNTRRYQADEDESDVLRTVYLQSTAFSTMPDHITVTITPS